MERLRHQSRPVRFGRRGRQGPARPGDRGVRGGRGPRACRRSAQPGAGDADRGPGRRRGRGAREGGGESGTEVALRSIGTAATAREQGDLRAVRRLERIIARGIRSRSSEPQLLDGRAGLERARDRALQLARGGGRRGPRGRDGRGDEGDRSSIQLNPQNAQSWFLATRIREATGDEEGAARALAEFEIIRPDDNARDRAIRLARSRSEIADHAAEPVAIYDLDGTRVEGAGGTAAMLDPAK